MSLTDQQKVDCEPGQGMITMGKTAKYCEDREKNLSPADKSLQRTLATKQPSQATSSLMGRCKAGQSWI